MTGVVVSIQITDEDSAMNALIASLDAGELSVEVGILDVAEQATIGFYQEMGTRNIPARPFISSTIDENVAKYEKALADGLAAVLDGRTTLEAALLRLGAVVAADIKVKITRLAAPPNAPSTIARKGSSNPLVDTGALRNAVNFSLE